MKVQKRDALYFIREPFNQCQVAAMCVLKRKLLYCKRLYRFGCSRFLARLHLREIFVQIYLLSILLIKLRVY
jgi:hypothetical protein